MYAFDVDGVIINSIKQIVIDSFNTHGALSGTYLLGEWISLRNHKKIFSAKKKIIEKFRKLLPYCKSAEEMIFFCFLIEKNITVKDDKEFRMKIHHISNSKKRQWEKEFYKQRHLFQKRKAWINVVKTFPLMAAFYKRHWNEGIIISNKDKNSIMQLFTHFHLPFKSENIYSKEITNDKNEKMRMICKRYNVDFKEIIFIDDNFTNLKEVLPLGVRCCMASWGFNNAKQRREARRLGITVISLKDLKKI